MNHESTCWLGLRLFQASAALFGLVFAIAHIGIVGASEAAEFDERVARAFYKGKTVRIVVGYAAGGGFDLTSRLIARHLGKYIPGNPSVIVENKPGAGSIIAAKAVYTTEPKDGTAMVTFTPGLILQQAMGDKRVQVDMRKFNWIGATDKTYTACVARTDSNVQKIEDTMQGKQLIVATQARGNASYDVPAILNTALGTNFKLVSGYGGVPEIFLAIERKEAESVCIGYVSVILASWRHMLEGPNPLLRPIIVMGSETPQAPFLESVPAAEAIAKTPEAKLLLRAQQLPSLAQFPYAVAPEVPRERVEALRFALSKTYADRDFLNEARKSARNIDPSTGDQVREIVEEVLNLPPTVLNRLKSILQ